MQFFVRNLLSCLLIISKAFGNESIGTTNPAVEASKGASDSGSENASEASGGQSNEARTAATVDDDSIVDHSLANDTSVDTASRSISASKWKPFMIGRDKIKAMGKKSKGKVFI